MGRVHLNHPDAGAATTTNSRSTPGEQEHEVRSGGEEEPSAVALTVWRKLLLLGCQDMTVFDSRGDLAFRVDCYASSRRRADVVLMGAAGEPLLMVRRARRLGGLLAAELVHLRRRRSHAGALRLPRRALASSKKALAHVTPLAGAASGGVAKCDKSGVGSQAKGAQNEEHSGA